MATRIALPTRAAGEGTRTQLRGTRFMMFAAAICGYATFAHAKTQDVTYTVPSDWSNNIHSQKTTPYHLEKSERTVVLAPAPPGKIRATSARVDFGQTARCSDNDCVYRYDENYSYLRHPTPDQPEDILAPLKYIPVADDGAVY